MGTRRVSLKAITKQIDKADHKLQLLARTAPVEERTEINEKIRRLKMIRREVVQVCGREYFLTFVR